MAIESPWVLRIIALRVQPRICHRFRDISSPNFDAEVLTFVRLLLLLLLNVFNNAPVCQRVTDKSWVRAVTWTVIEMRGSRGEYALSKSSETVSYASVIRQTAPDGRSSMAESI